MDDIVGRPCAGCGVAAVAFLLDVLKSVRLILLALWHSVHAMCRRALLIIGGFLRVVVRFGEAHCDCNLFVCFHYIGVVLEVGVFLPVVKVVLCNGFHSFCEVVESVCLCGVVRCPPFEFFEVFGGVAWRMGLGLEVLFLNRDRAPSLH